MLGAAQADAFGAQSNGFFGLFGRVGVGAHAHGAELIGPAHQGAKVAALSGGFDFQGAFVNDAFGAVNGNPVAFFDDRAIGRGELRGVMAVEFDVRAAANRRDAELTRDQSGVRSASAARGQNALRGQHALQVVRRGFLRAQNDRLRLRRLCPVRRRRPMKTRLCRPRRRGRR